MSIRKQYEIIEVDGSSITVDVSLLSKTDEMFFNATDMAKMHGKRVRDFLQIAPTKEYIDAILE